jgi:hypothetical protein
VRERWHPHGHVGFGADHFDSQSIHPERRTEYDNLFYACCSCNAARGVVPLPIDPAQTSIGTHLRIMRDGTAEALTAEGARLIAICHLNRPLLIDFRYRLLRLIETLAGNETLPAKTALKELLAFPDDLPDLAAKRPPEGNARSEGIAESCFERRQRGELPAVY